MDERFEDDLSCRLIGLMAAALSGAIMGFLAGWLVGSLR